MGVCELKSPKKMEDRKNHTKERPINQTRDQNLQNGQFCHNRTNLYTSRMQTQIATIGENIINQPLKIVKTSEDIQQQLIAQEPTHQAPKQKMATYKP